MEETKEKRTHKISFRLNQDEVILLHDFSKSAGISRSVILRNLIRKIQGDACIVKTDNLLATMNLLAAEQGRVNNNINQLAKHANQYSQVRDIDPQLFARFNTLFARYLEYQDMMNKTFKNIYKTIS